MKLKLHKFCKWCGEEVKLSRTFCNRSHSSLYVGRELKHTRKPIKLEDKVCIVCGNKFNRSSRHDYPKAFMSRKGCSKSCNIKISRYGYGS